MMLPLNNMKWPLIALFILMRGFLGSTFAEENDPPLPGPYEVQKKEMETRLASSSATARASAAESLGLMRCYAAEEKLLAALGDPSAEVRRESVMALGWCGGRSSILPLIESLDDSDWLVRQAAHVSLSNLTGMEFAYDALAEEKTRKEQSDQWRQWSIQLNHQAVPREILALLETPWGGHPDGFRATASTTYKGPPAVVLDGQHDGAYWQTKNVDPPQWIQIDLGKIRTVHGVVVVQYSEKFVMNGYEIAVSEDGKRFEKVAEAEGKTPVRLKVEFPERTARFVRITSRGSVNPTYPTTFFEVEILEPGRSAAHENSDVLSRDILPGVGMDPLRRTVLEQLRLGVEKTPDPQMPSDHRNVDPVAWKHERGLRSLGGLGIPGSSRKIIEILGPRPATSKSYRQAVRAGIRSLGRLREEAGFRYLLSLLEHPFWARYAAEALGDFGDSRAVLPLLDAYERFSKKVDGSDPPEVPRDDKMTFPSIDRMLETPYYIALSLTRLPIESEDSRKKLAELAPRFMANLPGDHDTFFLYEPEVGHRILSHLMLRSGRLEEAREHAMIILGQPARKEVALDPSHWSPFAADRIASWLPVVCRTSKDVPRLVLLLDHPEGWVRLNAAKALGWIGDDSAIPPLAERLRKAPAEAEFGYNPVFKNEEYDDPAPRWREGLLRALGMLGVHECTGEIIAVMNDERSVAEVRMAAAQALADLGNEQAEAALMKAARSHPIFCIRHTARDALREKGSVLEEQSPMIPEEKLKAETPPLRGNESSTTFDTLLFIQGSNDIPNTKGTVEQADRWRSTYAVTDSGPAYRPGRNLYLLSPPGPDGEIRPLTRFEGGYVADPELSWDAQEVVFSYRTEDDPWWHLYRIGIDGSGLEQLTFGPYHDVGPCYLPDGRLVFASSRSGIRDEYHGYPCTVLCTMDPKDGEIHPIATNIGRDNEPSILDDGRVVFSRLEVFYSRNKTELMLHAVYPDGTHDMVLYGPERRHYWRHLDHGPRTPADGQENPLTHRVLRPTQPQQMPDGRLIVSTQAGLTIVDGLRDREINMMADYRERSYTTPWPLPDGRILCASTLKKSERLEVDLGLYCYDPKNQRLELVYNDPEKADFEPRPVMARTPPPLRPTVTVPGAYSGQFICSSVFASQEPEVPLKGKYVRLIEGMPVIARHSTHTNQHEVWKNHGGTFARILGTIPLATDGSFRVEVPADRLMHFQVLDSNRRVVGNQKTWIYPRPGERKSCVGCHEHPHSTTRTLNAGHAKAAFQPSVDFLPTPYDFNYRAKAWYKGNLPSAIEERTRTVRAVNRIAR